MLTFQLMFSTSTQDVSVQHGMRESCTSHARTHKLPLPSRTKGRPCATGKARLATATHPWLVAGRCDHDQRGHHIATAARLSADTGSGATFAPQCRCVAPINVLIFASLYEQVFFVNLSFDGRRWFAIILARPARLGHVSEHARCLGRGPQVLGRLPRDQDTSTPWTSPHPKSS